MNGKRWRNGLSFLIDGHNLIPKIRGISLKLIDDENALIELLQEYCRIRRKRVEVFFDGAPAGKSGKTRMGFVTAHFVRVNSSADDAIANRLRRMGGEARNWNVVSSDRRVQSEARAAGATVVSADSFAIELEKALKEAPETTSADRTLSKSEVEAWLNLFSQKKNKGERK